MAWIFAFFFHLRREKRRLHKVWKKIHSDIPLLLPIMLLHVERCGQWPNRAKKKVHNTEWKDESNIFLRIRYPNCKFVVEEISLEWTLDK